MTTLDDVARHVGPDRCPQVPLVYHSCDAHNNDSPTLGMNRLGWSPDGWPSVEEKGERKVRGNRSEAKLRLSCSPLPVAL
jgi:hypothetical protein